MLYFVPHLQKTGAGFDDLTQLPRLLRAAETPAWFGGFFVCSPFMCVGREGASPAGFREVDRFVNPSDHRHTFDDEAMVSQPT